MIDFTNITINVPIESILNYFKNANYADYISWIISLLGFISFLLRNKIKIGIKKSAINYYFLSPIFYNLKNIKIDIEEKLHDSNKNLEIGLIILIDNIDQSLKFYLNDLIDGKTVLNDVYLKKAFKVFYKRFHKQIDDSICNKKNKDLIISSILKVKTTVTLSVDDTLQDKFYKTKKQKIEMLLMAIDFFIRDLIIRILRDL
jgi:hypothetical protein